MIFDFGPGVLYGFRTDVTNSTPINFGLIQEVSFDFGFDAKELYGQYALPIAIARGKGKLGGKAKLAQISGLTFGTLFWGMTPSTGQVASSIAESGSVPSSGPYTVTVAQAANFQDDYGVIFAATGLPLTKVASGPAANQYSVNTATGVYTFNSGQAGSAVLITYSYTISASGEQLAVTNPIMGTTPTFQAHFYGGTYGGKPVNIKFPNCMSSKLGFATKLDDFTIPEFDFSIFANAAGNILTWSFAEAS